MIDILIMIVMIICFSLSLFIFIMDVTASILIKICLKTTTVIGLFAPCYYLVHLLNN